MVMMRYSNDGGHTWPGQRLGEIGPVGAYKQRVAFNRCGSARDRVFEIAFSDPVPIRIVNAYLKINIGTS
jgi:hypothetical protein